MSDHSLRADLAGEGAPLEQRSRTHANVEWVYWWYCASSDVFTDGYSTSYGACLPAMPHRHLLCRWMLRTVDWDNVTNELAVDAHLEGQYDEAQGEES